MKNSHRWQAAAVLVVAATASGLFAHSNQTMQPQAAAAREAVVVELFTSEGCSSCPPADRLLTELENEKAGAGAAVIPLGFHVDYWDYQGWRDRFSSAQYTRRQQDYAEAFRLGGPYTPEMVVDGKREFVGNDAGRAHEVIAEEAKAPQQAEVSVSARGGKASIQVTAGQQVAGDVLLAVTEDNLSSNVGAGENEGRLLHHSAVVRELRTLGKLHNGSFKGTADLQLGKEWKPGDLRVVVFVQQPGNGKILGAASARLESLAANR